MRLNRRHALIGLGATLATPYVRPSWAAAGSVNVYNWSDYIGETTIADFEAETGIGVVYDLYASSEEMQAKMLAGSSGYDVVLQAGLTLPQAVQAGVYQKIDHSRLTNWGNLDPEILKIVEGFDPGNSHGVPYMWGSVGITYNLDMVKERLPDADLNSLDTLFKPENAAKLADCGISILDSPTDIGFAVLKWLGINPDTAGPAEMAKMAEAFAAIRPHIATFDNSNYLTAIPNGELCAVNNWSGDYGVAKARAAEAGIEMNLAYFVPRTGAPAWFDLWSMPTDAPNTDNAYKFIDYMLRAEVAAACTNYTGYANANKAATPLVDPAIASDPAVYPDAETLSRLYTPQPQTPEQEEAMTRVWTEIKTGG
ncbi:polyamine ABC transporter substrate-binding protein [Gemmobacter lutimaris]|uniref:Putrescine-binding periplasmic protein n=1 Tax=Gemmobacter lutimaris TaxID=2306023 RepID=A0A398BV77_9RHOB|nr:polyamine ABC transporter substrate-binding protein [Gemmobacter lutimaris]RID91116.1 polyamine ABC transporter substrate-binding protein [Gemmobacter lutimaris]